MKFYVFALCSVSLCLLTSWTGSQSTPDKRSQFEPKLMSVDSILEHIKPQENSPVRIFTQGEHCTVNVIQAKSQIKSHYHAKHEEVVYVVSGTGTMRLGNRTYTVKSGDLMYIPKNTVHGFTLQSQECVVVSVFSPTFDGKDRIFVDDK
ncbi:MAG TPA: cupin domain-containing protein [Fimbriimonadales bacterium]|nr:cupin domain-containing protein [Fimbriimonadales bacterium]